jgi:hypothetical protein
MLIDFVQWGAAGMPNESTAHSAGYWTTGDFVDAVADGHTMSYCPTVPGQRGEAAWIGIVTPNPGTSDCATPTMRPSWGRVKVVHR